VSGSRTVHVRRREERASYPGGLLGGRVVGVRSAGFVRGGDGATRARRLHARHFYRHYHRRGPRGDDRSLHFSS
jgi:hypothetical protein